MQRGPRTGIHAGASSILVSFVLLCLTTFATLSMVSALADFNLTQKAAEASRRYYQADALAEQRLEEVDRCLADALARSGDAETYFALCAAELERLGDYQTSVNGNILEVRYQVPMEGNRELHVALDAGYSPGAPRYSRRLWQVVTIQQWELEESPLELWDGGESMAPLWDGGAG